MDAAVHFENHCSAFLRTGRENRADALQPAEQREDVGVGGRVTLNGGNRDWELRGNWPPPLTVASRVDNMCPLFFRNDGDVAR